MSTRLRHFLIILAIVVLMGITNVTFLSINDKIV